MHIIYHHRTRAMGAEGIHIREIYRAFERNGHSVELVSLTNKGVVEEANTKGGNKREYSHLKEFFVKLSRKPFALLYNIPGVLYLYMKISQSVDFIYERYSLYNISGVLVAKLKKIPLVLEVNAPYAYEVEEHELPLFPNFAKKVEKMIFREAHRIIVVSESLKNYLCKLDVPEHKIMIMHNGVDFSKFDLTIKGDRVRKMYSLENKTVIGFIGGLEPHHGLIKLIDGIANIKVSVSLLLVGSGSLERELKEKVRVNEIDAIFTGRVLHEEIPEYIAAMDICIKPDANPYCSPMKIFEYMAMNKPIIAGDTPSIREVLSDERAILIKPTAVEIRKSIEILVNNRVLSDTISLNAYNYVRDNFSWDKNVKKVIKELK